MIKMKRKPTSPGELLRDEFLRPMGITQKGFADHIGCDVKVINRIINQRSVVTVDIAIRIAAALRTSPEFWLNAQRELDIYNATKTNRSLPKPYPFKARVA